MRQYEHNKISCICFDFLKINLTCSIFTNVYIYNISRVIDM
jgi:hypothetical protein